MGSAPNNIQLSSRVNEADTCKLRHRIEHIIDILNNKFYKCANELFIKISQQANNLENIVVRIPANCVNDNREIYVGDIDKLTLADMASTLICLNVTGDNKVKINYKGIPMSELLAHILVKLNLQDKYYIDTFYSKVENSIKYRFCKILL